MGYRSNVYLKTTTEGWVILKKFNDELTEDWSDKPLAYSVIERTAGGNYKITWEDIKWYDSYASVQHLYEVLNIYEMKDIPYSFIRIGEEECDCEHKRSYVDDMPWEIEGFEPIVTVNDEDSSYEFVEDNTSEHIELKPDGCE